MKFALALAALFIAAPAFAEDESPITTSADHAIIMDYATGDVLYEKAAEAPTAPASMSKLMTVAIVFDKLEKGELKLTDEFSVSEKAWRMGGSKMWVRVNTKIPLEDLLRGIVIDSGNDACIVVAENIVGSEDAFAILENKKAREWGLNNSSFANATGWPDPKQKMSMHDLAILARKIIHDYPEYYALFGEKDFTWEKIYQPNRNPILGVVDGADGLKTGHTEESGFGLVGSAVQNGVRRIVVLNGLDSEHERATEGARMLRMAFNDFTTKTLYKPGDIVGDAQVFKGAVASVPLMAKEPVSLILHRSLADDVKTTVVYEGPVTAPIAADQQIGYLKVDTGAGSPREYPLYAAKAVNEVGILGKIALGAGRLLARPSSAEAAETAH